MRIGRINYLGSYGLAAAAALTLADDVGANYDKLVAKVDKLETTDESLKTFVNGLKAELADKTQKLTEALDQIAAQGGDTTKLTEVRDGLQALADRIDAVEAADAVIATT